VSETKPHIFDLNPDSLESIVTAMNMSRFRTGQILEWVYQRGVLEPTEMTNLSKRDREALRENIAFTPGEIVKRQDATDGTVKLLVRWPNQSLSHNQWHRFSTGASAAQRSDSPLVNLSHETVSQHHRESISLTGCESECVMIPSKSGATDHSTRPRRTACISSQVGCPVGCVFCASGIGGLDGNLTTGQIVEQVWRLNQLEVEPERITNVVFMGMGEPLANYQAVVGAVRTLIAPWGMGVGGRKITISTVGLPNGIRQLAEEGLPITLAISLHAPNDDLRQQLIPWSKRVSINEILEAGRDYFDRTGREVTLEYLLLGRVNDRQEHAEELAEKANTLRANVNLIRYNEVPDLPFTRPADKDVHRFQQILRKRGVNAHIRASRGRDIAAACGQLRHENTRNEPH